jgi:hypothetical protein
MSEDKLFSRNYIQISVDDIGRARRIYELLGFSDFDDTPIEGGVAVNTNIGRFLIIEGGDCSAIACNCIPVFEFGNKLGEVLDSLKNEGYAVRKIEDNPIHQVRYAEIEYGAGNIVGIYGDLC